MPAIVLTGTAIDGWSEESTNSALATNNRIPAIMMRLFCFTVGETPSSFLGASSHPFFAWQFHAYRPIDIFSALIAPSSDVTDELTVLRTIARYQFGATAGDALFPTDDEERNITYSANGKPRQVRDGTGRLVTLGQDGRFTLGFAGGRRLFVGLEPPGYRVVVGDESIPFVRDGDSAFAKFVLAADPVIRPGDEVLVVDSADETLLAVGRAELGSEGMAAFDRGVAVSIREGRDEWERNK